MVDGPVRPVQGYAAWLVYVVCLVVGSLIGGVDYDELTESTGNVLKGIVLPVGIGSAAMIVLATAWGIWAPVLREERVAPRFLRAVPVAFAVIVVVALVSTPWGDWGTGLLLLVLLGTLMVGFGEELMSRGILVTALRGGRMSEVRVWLISTALFAVMHGLNFVFGQDAGPTLQQIVSTFIVGSGLYLIRRWGGLLVVCMLVHAVYDFSVFAASGPGETTEAVSGDVPAVVQIMGTLLIITIIVVLVRWLRHRDEDGRLQGSPAATA